MKIVWTGQARTGRAPDDASEDVASVGRVTSRWTWACRWGPSPVARAGFLLGTKGIEVIEVVEPDALLAMAMPMEEGKSHHHGRRCELVPTHDSSRLCAAS